MTKFAVMDHDSVPEHILLSTEDHQLPKIHINDPAAKEIGAKVGDIIKIVRRSPTAKQSVFYRLVID